MNGSISLIQIKLRNLRKNVKVLYRRISKDNSYKPIVFIQAQEGVFGKYIQDNFDLFKKFFVLI